MTGADVIDCVKRAKSSIKSIRPFVLATSLFLRKCYPAMRIAGACLWYSCGRGVPNECDENALLMARPLYLIVYYVNTVRRNG